MNEEASGASSTDLTDIELMCHEAFLLSYLVWKRSRRALFILLLMQEACNLSSQLG